MTHFYEAEVSEDGQVRLREPLALRGCHRALVTVLEPLGSEDAAHRQVDPNQDWRRFAGVMKDSPHFNGDCVVIQKAMRDE